MYGYRNDYVDVDVFVGKSVVRASMEDGTLELSDGTVVEVSKENDDCCSWIELVGLSTTDHIITHAEYGDDEDETGGEGGYKAWIRVITEAGELNIAEADGDASNGYYLHGFALGLRVINKA